jgi:high-affinity K+ transport system ATPase subunit B
MSTKVDFSYKALFRQATIDAFKKLHPRDEIKNLVMLVVWLGAIWTTLILFLPGQFNLFNVQICFWLWFTCLFANFAEAMAEGRGKAHADALRKMRTTTMARAMVNGKQVPVPSSELKVGDYFVCETGEVIPADGEVVEGIATVDESAITGESAPVVRESGGDRSAVTGGTKVLSDRIVVRVTSEAGHSFLDRMIEMIEGARRQKTPNEIALNIVLVALTALFIVVVFVLPPCAHYNETQAGQKGVVLTTISVLLSLIVCLIPTTIGGLLSAIGRCKVLYLKGLSLVEIARESGCSYVALRSRTGAKTGSPTPKPPAKLCSALPPPLLSNVAKPGLDAWPTCLKACWTTSSASIRPSANQDPSKGLCGCSTSSTPSAAGRSSWIRRRRPNETLLPSPWSLMSP